MAAITASRHPGSHVISLQVRNAPDRPGVPGPGVLISFPRPPIIHNSLKERGLAETDDTDFTTEDTWRVFRIMAEFVEGFETLSRVPRAVTVFGSARGGAGDPETAGPRSSGRALAQAGHAVITGGGPGSMEAVNKGAREAGGESIGVCIELPREDKPNAYLRG